MSDEEPREKMERIMGGHRSVYRHLCSNGRFVNPYRKDEYRGSTGHYINGEFIRRSETGGYRWVSWTQDGGEPAINFKIEVSPEGIATSGEVNCFSIGRVKIVDDPAYLEEYMDELLSRINDVGDSHFWHAVDVSKEDLKTIEVVCDEP